MDSKLMHLELVQNVVQRMAGNSFLLKGWSVTLVSALFALAAKDSNPYFLFVAYFPCVSFWILDGFFLWQETLYRELYNSVRITADENIDFSLDTSVLHGRVDSWGRRVCSRTLLIFHGIILVTITVVSAGAVFAGGN